MERPLPKNSLRIRAKRRVSWKCAPFASRSGCGSLALAAKKRPGKDRFYTGISGWHGCCFIPIKSPTLRYCDRMGEVMKLVTDLGRWLHRSALDDVERMLDEQLDHSFPASDPPSFTPLSKAHRTARAVNKPERRAG